MDPSKNKTKYVRRRVADAVVRETTHQPTLDVGWVGEGRRRVSLFYILIRTLEREPYGAATRQSTKTNLSTDVEARIRQTRTFQIESGIWSLGNTPGEITWDYFSALPMIRL